MYLLVCDGVVELEVLHVQKTDDLWEGVVYPIQKCFACVVDGFAKGDDEHDFAFEVGTDDDGSQLSLVCTFVVEGDVVLLGVGSNAIAYLVVDIIH